MHTIAVALLAIAFTGADVGKCPISGGPAKEEHFLDVNGKKINFCCDKCPKAYAKKIGLSEEVISKVCPISKKDGKEETKLIHRRAELVYFCCGNCPKGFLAKEKLELVDKGPKKCPVSGKEATAENALVVNGEKLYFCCGNCPKAYLKELGAVDKGPEKCCVSGKDAKAENVLVSVKSETVLFCCNDCRGKYIAANFKKDEGSKEAQKEPAKPDLKKFD